MEQQETDLRAEYANLKQRLEDPSIYSSKDYPALARRDAKLSKTIALFDQRKMLASQMAEAEKMKNSGDAELAELAQSEIDNLHPKIEENEAVLTEALLQKDPNDERDCIVEVRAAAGGDEASLFAGDLYRMYIRWCEKNNYKTKLINE